MSKEFKIYRNKRVGAGYELSYGCDYCDRHTTQVLELPKTIYNAYQHHICRTCLDEMCQALDKNMVDNFESDFQNERKCTNLSDSFNDTNLKGE